MAGFTEVTEGLAEFGVSEDMNIYGEDICGILRIYCLPQCTSCL